MSVSEHGIQDVWQNNLEDAFKLIRKVVKDYPYIAMDTEFPGIVFRAEGEFRNNAEMQFHIMIKNVNMLRLIQLGIAFFNEKGETASPIHSWQFNFYYDISLETYSQDSIDMLTRCGIQWDRLKNEGINGHDFAELLMSSGVVLCDDVKWISFHSGFDFGYTLKLLTCQPLPSNEAEFFDIMRLYFPIAYDVKFLMRSCRNLKGGLQELADVLKVERIGQQHQAGSDSLLTGMVFFKMREMYFEDMIDDAKYSGHLYGYESTPFQPPFNSTFCTRISTLPSTFNNPPQTSNNNNATSSTTTISAVRGSASNFNNENKTDVTLCSSDQVAASLSDVTLTTVDSITTINIRVCDNVTIPITINNAALNLTICTTTSGEITSQAANNQASSCFTVASTASDFNTIRCDGDVPPTSRSMPPLLPAPTSDRNTAPPPSTIPHRPSTATAAPPVVPSQPNQFVNVVPTYGGNYYNHPPPQMPAFNNQPPPQNFPLYGVSYPPPQANYDPNQGQYWMGPPYYQANNWPW